MPVSAVAPFAIAASLRTYFDDIFRRVGYVFFPAATELDAQGDENGLRNLYLVSSKFMFLGSILLGSMAIFWARDFFRLWLGPAYAEPAGYPSVTVLFHLLVLGSVISVAQRIGYQVLLGTRRIQLLATLFVAEAVSNVVVSVVLVREYGLIGIAIGTLVPAVVYQGLLQPIFVCRSLQISLKTYGQQVLLRPTFAALMLVPLLVTSLWLEQPDSWLTLCLGASMTFVLAAIVVLVIGFNKSERDLLLVWPAIVAFRYLWPMRISRTD
jgi:O-antigen/teichoic acid export membrane protein